MSVNILTQNGLQRIHTVRVQKDSKIRENDVNFYDYDGTLVNSYTKTEFLALSALPPNPSHNGLTAQGWNWSLSDAKAYVANYGALNIGQTYITSDGKTRLYISLHEGRLSPQLGLGINGSVDVDWGDGSAHDTMTGSSISTVVYRGHTYAQEGDYVIALTVTGNARIIGSDSSIGKLNSKLLTDTNGNDNSYKVYLNALRKVEMGTNMDIGQYAFSYCNCLISITIAKGITNLQYGAFLECYSLVSVTIPNGVVGSTGNFTFDNCHSIKTIMLPKGITSIGESTFRQCYSLTSILLPEGITIIERNAFRHCYGFTKITMPESIETIGSNAYGGCYSPASVTIPKNVTNINSGAFNSNYGLGIIEFQPLFAPVVASDNNWLGILTDCLIFIPYTSPTSYFSAANYPSPFNYTYLGYNTFNEGEELPTTSSDENYNYTWYATLDDATAQTNPISVGTGNKIYCRFAAV